jgi:hypothetical protein
MSRHNLAEDFDLEEEAEQADEYVEPHYLGAEYFAESPEDCTDPELADGLEWELENLQLDLWVALHDLEQSVGPYDPERPQWDRVEAVEALLKEFGR